MNEIKQSGTYKLGDKTVYRMGYGAMQLAGPGVFGLPSNVELAHEVLKTAIDQGINHIDTSDFYGPYVTNQIIKDALSPYADTLLIATKIGARRDEQGNWLPAFSGQELEDAVRSNLNNLGLEQLDIVNFRAMFSVHGPAEGSIARQVSVLAKLQSQGLIKHIGLSNVTAAQVKEAQGIAPIVCVQNQYNLVNRTDDALIDSLNVQNIAYVPFFPIGGFSPLQSDMLSSISNELKASTQQVALAWLLRRAPNILLIPGTSSPAHLKENIAAVSLFLSDDIFEALDEIYTR